MVCLVSLESRDKKDEWVPQVHQDLQVHKVAKERRVTPECRES